MKSMPAGTDGRAILQGSLGGELFDMSLEGRQGERQTGRGGPGREKHGGTPAGKSARVEGPLCVGLFTVKP